MANPLGDYIPALRYGVSKVQSNEMQGITGQLTTGGTFEVSGAFAGTLNLTATTSVTLPTSGVLVSSANAGTFQIAWPAIGTTNTQKSGTITLTGLALNSPIFLTRREDTADGVFVAGGFVSAANSLHVIFGQSINGGVAAGTAIVSYIYTTP